jgi:hypothetical protein
MYLLRLFSDFCFWTTERLSESADTQNCDNLWSKPLYLPDKQTAALFKVIRS